VLVRGLIHGVDTGEVYIGLGAEGMQRHTASSVQLIIWHCQMLRSELMSLLKIELGINHVHSQQYQ